MEHNLWAVAGIALVALATFTIGFRSSRQASTTQDFLTARRTVRSRRNAAAVSGEYLSAASFLGVAGLVLKDGADALWYPIGFTAGFRDTGHLVAFGLLNQRTGAALGFGDDAVAVGDRFGLAPRLVLLCARHFALDADDLFGRSRLANRNRDDFHAGVIRIKGLLHQVPDPGLDTGPVPRRDRLESGRSDHFTHGALTDLFKQDIAA